MRRYEPVGHSIVADNCKNKPKCLSVPVCYTLRRKTIGYNNCNRILNINKNLHVPGTRLKGTTYMYQLLVPLKNCQYQPPSRWESDRPSEHALPSLGRSFGHLRKGGGVLLAYQKLTDFVSIAHYD